MCLKKMSIKSSSPFAPKELFIPCGNCTECRQVYRTGWRIRLQNDLEHYTIKKGWKIGFFTLTYSASALPSLPSHLLRNPQDVIPCFNRVHARTFIDNLRKWLWKHYKITNVRYLMASEYGENTRRPHYHGIICWPVSPYNFTDSKGNIKTSLFLSPEQLHAQIQKTWSHGFTFPEKYDGSGYYDKSPFEVQAAPAGVANYASKYCVKDLAFIESIEKKVVDMHSKELRQYKGFHIQSKSLGLDYIKNLSEKEKLELVRDGIFTAGQAENCPLPLYYKKKILFNPYYIIDEKTGKRLVRQEASDFLLKHYQVIFNKKVDFYKSTFDLVRSADYQHLIKDETEKRIIQNIPIPSRDLAIYYVAFYGTILNHLTIRPADAWLSRYIQNCDKLPFYDNGNLPSKFRFDYYINLLFQQLESETETTKKVYEEREKNRIQDFHNNTNHLGENDVQ